MFEDIKLDLAEADHTALYEAANGKGKMTRVNRVALITLLSDHAKVLAAANNAGIRTKLLTGQDA